MEELILLFGVTKSHFKMEFEILLQFLEKFGIMAVLGWFMLRLEGIINKNTEALQNLSLEIAKKRK